MPKRRKQFVQSYFVPFTLWISLAARTAEMMLASSQVVGHRARRIALAGARPSARDRREFALMGWEKVDAGARSVQAMGSLLLNGNQTLWLEAFHNMRRSTAAAMMLFTSRGPAQFIARQIALAESLGNSLAGFASASKNTARLAHRGLEPIRVRATANAKRLGRRS